MLLFVSERWLLGRGTLCVWWLLCVWQQLLLPWEMPMLTSMLSQVCKSNTGESSSDLKCLIGLLVGAVGCSALSLILPCMIHLKLRQQDWHHKLIDGAIIVFAVVASVLALVEIVMRLAKGGVSVWSSPCLSVCSPCIVSLHVEIIMRAGSSQYSWNYCSIIASNQLMHIAMLYSVNLFPFHLWLSNSALITSNELNI